MIIAPCSIKTVSGIANCYADNLMVRAADVVLKERRKLVLVPRETPLHTGHCRLFYELSQMGVILAPPVPAFYLKPEPDRAMEVGLEVGMVSRWQGPATKTKTETEPETKS